MAKAAPKTRRLWLAWLSGILLLVVVGIVIARRGEELRFADLLKHAHPSWLLGAVVLQIGTYACAAGAWQRVLARQHIHTSFWQLIPLGLAKLFMDQVVPSAGLSGTLLVVRALTRRGVPNGASASAVVVGLLGFYLAYGLALVTTLVLLAVSGDLSRRMLSLAIVASFLIGAVVVALFWLLRGRRGPVRSLLMRIPGLKGFLQELHDAPKEALHDKTLLLQTTVLQFGIFVLDAATLGRLPRRPRCDGEPHGLVRRAGARLTGRHDHAHPERAGDLRRDDARHAAPGGRLDDAWGRRGAAVPGLHADAPAPPGAVAGAPGDEREILR